MEEARRGDILTAPPVCSHHVAHTAMEHVLQAPTTVARRQVDAALSA
jgi:hypothetical protein